LVLLILAQFTLAEHVVAFQVYPVLQLQLVKLLAVPALLISPQLMTQAVEVAIHR
jgi:hypothetical protein